MHTRAKYHKHKTNFPIFLQTAIDFVNYVTDSCVSASTKIYVDDLVDLIEDIMDQEFDTICEDDSIREISTMLLKYLELLRTGQIDLIRAEFSQLPACANWIAPGTQINYVQTQDDESSSEDDSNDDINDANASNTNQTKNAPSTSGSTMEVMEEDVDVDPGWTVVKQKGNKKRF
jgi:pre-rRNA-processing protein TSR2